MFLKLLILFTSFSALAQEVVTPAMVELVPLKSKSELIKREISEAEINRAIEASRKDLKDIVGEEEFKKFKPIGVDIDAAKLSILAKKPVIPFRCDDESSPIKNMTKNADDIVKALQSEHGDSLGGMIYITWGYNRAWFSNTDTTFHTPDGTFTIHDAVAQDRPSTEFTTYISPSKFSIPQYNLRIGYKFNEKWSVEIGTDHMKWVFAPDTGYKITGNYNRPLWVREKDENGNWYGDHETSFAEVQKTGNTDFVHFEHSDGYNYPHASAFFTQTLLKSKNDRFRLDASVGAGAGILFPKTRVMIRDTDEGNWRDVDNKFHVAGWGAHAEANAKLIYKTKASGREYFIQTSNRGMVGKINNALFLGSQNGSISQAPIYTYEVYVSVGYAQSLGDGKKKK